MVAIADLPATLVVDASIGVKWVIDEAGSAIAVDLIAGRHLIVPDLFWIETANALTAKVRRNELSRAQAQDAWRDLAQAPVQSRPATAGRLAPALNLAHDLSHPIYDCIYLALGIEEHAKVITADRKFVEIVRSHPYLGEQVVLLDDLVRSET